MASRTMRRSTKIEAQEAKSDEEIVLVEGVLCNGRHDQGAEAEGDKEVTGNKDRAVDVPSQPR